MLVGDTENMTLIDCEKRLKIPIGNGQVNIIPILIANLSICSIYLMLKKEQCPSISCPHIPFRVDELIM